MNKNQITKGLLEIGACWATTPKKCILPNDGFEAKKAYHIHPNASNPEQNGIKRFYSLCKIAKWLKAIKAANAAPSEAEAFDIMQRFWANLS